MDSVFRKSFLSVNQTKFISPLAWMYKVPQETKDHVITFSVQEVQFFKSKFTAFSRGVNS